MSATFDSAELMLQRDAEDQLLALLARGIREAAESRRMPILRIVSVREASTEGTK